MLSHHTWSPCAPLINVVAQCMPVSEPKWLFFEGLSKQSDVKTLNWGEGGMQVSSQWVWQDACFFEEPGMNPHPISAAIAMSSAGALARSQERHASGQKLLDRQAFAKQDVWNPHTQIHNLHNLDCCSCQYLPFYNYSVGLQDSVISLQQDLTDQKRHEKAQESACLGHQMSHHWVRSIVWPPQQALHWDALSSLAHNARWHLWCGPMTRTDSWCCRLHLI